MFELIKKNTRLNYLKLIKKLKFEDCIHYIGVGIYLPPPLTPEEEQKCIETLSLSDSRQKLIEHNLRLVVYIAKKFEQLIRLRRIKKSNSQHMQVVALKMKY